MPTIVCPACKVGFVVGDRDIAESRTVRCPDCGRDLHVRRKAADTVAFPKGRADETLMDLSDAIKAVKKKRKKE